MTVEYCSTPQEIKRSVSVTDHTKYLKKKQTKYDSSHDKADVPINANTQAMPNFRTSNSHLVMTTANKLHTVQSLTVVWNHYE